jgi:hypothetical protein
LKFPIIKGTLMSRLSFSGRTDWQTKFAGDS